MRSLPSRDDCALSTSVNASGPNDTVELATDQNSIVDTYGTGASGSCPANGFCADVTLTHFYPGVALSALTTFGKPAEGA